MGADHGHAAPLSDAEWHRLYALYQQIPQYSLVNDASVSPASNRSLAGVDPSALGPADWRRIPACR